MYDVIHVLHHILYSTVTAQVSLESLIPQPNCTNITLTFNCQLHLSSFSIEWKHTKLGSLGYIDGDESVGYRVNTAGGRIVAVLTRKDTVQNTTIRFLFSSTLTIYPPLNNVNNTNFNNTNITCEGVDRDVFRSGSALISLYGEQLWMCFIMYDYVTHCLCVYLLQVPLPLLMT